MHFGKTLDHIIIETFWLLLFCAVIGVVIVGVCIDYTNPTFKKIGTIKCYSGNTLIYEGKSTGAISNLGNFNYLFQELGTDNFMEVSGNCIIEYDNYVTTMTENNNKTDYRILMLELHKKNQTFLNNLISVVSVLAVPFFV